MAVGARRLTLAPVKALDSGKIVTAEEASLVTRLTVSALAVRRVKKQWPPYAKFGRLVRYQMGDLLCPVGFSAKSERRTDEPEGPVEIPTSPMPSRFT